MMADAMLEYEKKVQHNSQLTMTDLRAQMSAGKISAQDATNVIEELGQKYSKASDNLMQTIPGMTRVIKSRIPALIGDIEKPFLTAQNPVLGAISRWSQDKNTDKEFGKLGQAMSKGLSTITSAFAKAFDLSAGPKAMDKMMDKLSDAVTKVSQSIASHAGQIKTFFTTISTTGSAMAKISWAALTSGLKVLNPLLKSLGDFADKHPKLFGDLAAGFIALNLAGKVLPIAAITGFTKSVGGMYSGLKKLANSKFADMIKTNLSKLNSSALGKGMATITIAYDAISDIKDLTKAFSKGGTVGQKFSSVGESAGTLIGGGIGAFFGGPLGAAIGATIGKVAGKWAGDAAKKFTDGWNAKKKPADSWLGGLGWDARQMTNNVVKWWDGINKSTDAAQKKQQKQQEAANKQAQKDWNGFWNDVGKGWTGFWNDVNKKNSNAQQQQQKQQDAANKQIKKDWDSFWSNASKGWNNFWSDTVKNAQNGMNSTKSGIDNANTSIHKGWDSFWSDTSKNWNGFWGNVGKNAQNGMSTVHGWISDGNSKIDSGWRSLWSGLKSFFGNIWDGIKDAAANGMNAVINVINGAISGINWVWEKFTGKDALRKLSPVHFATGGTVTQKMHLVMVNDGTGPDWKELYQLPNGQIGMSQQRNATGLLPEGTRVFNGKETKAIMNMAGVEHYDLGGVIGGVGKFFSGAWDKLEAVGDWLANPIGKVTDLIKSSISGISGGVEMFSNLASGVINKLTGSVVDWFKKELAKLQDTLGANPGGSGVQRWKPYVIQALKANGFDASDYQVAAWMRVIQRESNGNPRAINLWDSNAKAGIPSMGLVQTIGPTFNAYKFPGHNDVYNGYDDLLAGIHYMKAIYGSGSSAFARVSGPEGYANGGLITQPIHALVGEDGPETILPLTKTSRAWQLLGQAVTNINHNLGNGAVAESESSGTDDLGKKLDNIADLLTKLSFVLQVGDDQFYPKVAPKVKQYNDRRDRFNAYWKGGTV